jgi:hypothetical protein
LCGLGIEAENSNNLFKLHLMMTTSRRWIFYVVVSVMTRQTVELQVSSDSVEVAQRETILTESSQTSGSRLWLKALKPQHFLHPLVDGRRHRSLEIGMWQ